MRTYTFTVTVMRDYEDDCEAIGKKNPTASQLIQQLRKELQDGWDKAEIAGHFDISDVTLPHLTPGNG